MLSKPYKLLIIRTNFEGSQEIVLKGVHHFKVITEEKQGNGVLSVFPFSNRLIFYGDIRFIASCFCFFKSAKLIKITRCCSLLHNP